LVNRDINEMIEILDSGPLRVRRYYLLNGK
jgi:hypothetical protein